MKRGRRPAPSAPVQGLRLLKQRIEVIRRALERDSALLQAATEEAKDPSLDLEMDPETEWLFLLSLRLAGKWMAESLMLFEGLQKRVERGLKRRPTERRLLRLLKAQPQGEAELTYQELAERISASRWATIQAVKHLEERGELEVIRRGGGRHHKNLFRLVKRSNHPEI